MAASLLLSVGGTLVSASVSDSTTDELVVAGKKHSHYGFVSRSRLVNKEDGVGSH